MLKGHSLKSDKLHFSDQTYSHNFMIKTIEPVRSLNGVITDLPADKSIAHRAALFAAIAKGDSTIKNYSNAADPQSTLECLKGLGVDITMKGSTIVIHGRGRKGLRPVHEKLDCGNSGTTMRLLSGILSGSNQQVCLTGDASLSSRPMARVLNPLREMGALCESTEGERAPLCFKNHGGLEAITYELPMASAQVKSCVLLAGLFARGETRVVENLPSRDHTERMLGLEIDFNADGTRVIKSSRSVELRPINMSIPGDISGAAFWMVAGSLVPDSRIELKQVGINPTRSAVMSILKRMGADIRIANTVDDASLQGGEPTADIIIKSNNLKAVELLPAEIPNAIDEIPVLAVAMCMAKGTSKVRGATELRAKETDRISAVVEMLTKAGADVTEYEDGFEVKGNPDFVPKPAVYASHHDHRIAMASAVMAMCASDSSSIEGADCVAVSYPSFFEHLTKLSS